MLMEGHVAMDYSWPWTSWAKSRLCLSVVVVSEDPWGFHGSKTRISLQGCISFLRVYSQVPQVYGYLGVAITHHGD